MWPKFAPIMPRTIPCREHLNGEVQSSIMDSLCSSLFGFDIGRHWKNSQIPKSDFKWLQNSDLQVTSTIRVFSIANS